MVVEKNLPFGASNILEYDYLVSLI